MLKLGTVEAVYFLFTCLDMVNCYFQPHLIRFVCSCRCIYTYKNCAVVCCAFGRSASSLPHLYMRCHFSMPRRHECGHFYTRTVVTCRNLPPHANNTIYIDDDNDDDVDNDDNDNNNKNVSFYNQIAIWLSTGFQNECIFCDYCYTQLEHAMQHHFNFESGPLFEQLQLIFSNFELYTYFCVCDCESVRVPTFLLL